MRVVIADSEKAYLDNLRTRLQTLVAGVRIDTFQTQEDFLADPGRDDADQLILYNTAAFPDLHAYYEGRGHSCCKLIALSPVVVQKDDDWEKSEPGLPIWRHQPVRILAQKIIAWQACLQDRLTSESSEGSIHFLFCAEPAGYSPGQSKCRLRQMLDRYQTVLYLPLMPTYQMQLVRSPGQGSNLSDLMLHLMSGDITSEQIGHYLQPHPDGFLQFRPPDRSDDLIAGGPDILRQLVVFVRNHIANSAGRIAALIDCAALPFASLSAVAVLCDCCEIILPEGDSFAAAAARGEAARLLAELPSGTRIIGNNAGGSHVA